MRVGLIVDSACDLPYEFSRKHDLFVLPVTAVIDGQTYIDEHDPVRTQEFYQGGLLQKGHHAETQAFSPQQIHDLFMEKIVTQFDVAICETVTRSRSLIFQNATEAMNTVMSHYEEARKAAGRDGKFSMRVIDSKQIFAGQGLLAAHTLRLIEQKLSKNALRNEVETFTDKIYTCVIPRDLHYIRERARKRGDKSVSALVAFLGKALNITPVIFGQGAQGQPAAKTRSFDMAVEKVMNYAAGRVEAGLLTPYVSLSCGLTWTEIEDLPGLNRLRDACESNGVELLLSQMGITSSIYVGPGSLCLALAAEPHEFSDFQ
ncbi:DegV family EDD domain-containing protein [Marinobacter panjinensis]|uniref:DegV family EDD domain-containing protein n=1 Tax=Marinobacter panjinensis TaxID=2576384 RepID=A0A4U6QTK5_9GAMM|nr:DegV family protein [Marinobacter panjinensis]MCR8915149.1 DegV family protein [Marinobacter panjinensis]TKV64374.1 DegV family EDD domain-containing protein [Marinobacter panjinensis]